jgi:hypothetical protein
MRRRDRDHQHVAVAAVLVMVHATRDHHDVVGHRGQRHKLLDAADLESLAHRPDFGLHDLQVRSPGLLRRADAQHRLAADGLFADVLEVVGPAEAAQDGRSPNRAG